MNKKGRVIVIGVVPIGSEIAQVAKRLSEVTEVVSFKDAVSAIESFSFQMKKVGEAQIQAIKDFSVAVEKLNLSQEFPKQKSKYFNKPQHNFKGKFIPKNRNKINNYNKR